MKTLLKISFIVILTVLFIQPAKSQRLLRRLQDKVQDRVEQKVEERAEKKVDEVIDNQLDKLEESLVPASDESTENAGSRAERDSRRQDRMQNLLKGIGVSGEPVPVADSYNFNHLIQMKVESFDKNGKKESEGQFITHLNPQNKSMAYEMI